MNNLVRVETAFLKEYSANNTHECASIVCKYLEIFGYKAVGESREYIQCRSSSNFYCCGIVLETDCTLYRPRLFVGYDENKDYAEGNARCIFAYYDIKDDAYYEYLYIHARTFKDNVYDILGLIDVSNDRSGYNLNGVCNKLGYCGIKGSGYDNCEYVAKIGNENLYISVEDGECICVDGPMRYKSTNSHHRRRRVFYCSEVGLNMICAIDEYYNRKAKIHSTLS